METKKQYFKIGEMAELFDLNIRTLRYYDQIGLVKPEFIDPDSGYRYYSTAQFEPLNTIRYLRELGVSLDEIRSFLSNRDIDTMKELMHAQLTEVEARQRDLELVRRKLQTRLRQIEAAETGAQGEVEFRWIGERRATLLRYALSPDTDLEYPIRLLAKTIGARGVFLGMVGLSIDGQRLAAGECDNYDYIFLLPEEGMDGMDSRFSFPAGEYAVLRFRGTHSAATEQYQILHDAIRVHGYEICGNSLEITLIDYGLTDDPENFVTELQIPVKKK